LPMCPSASWPCVASYEAVPAKFQARTNVWIEPGDALGGGTGGIGMRAPGPPAQNLRNGLSNESKSDLGRARGASCTRARGASCTSRSAGLAIAQSLATDFLLTSHAADRSAAAYFRLEGTDASIVPSRTIPMRMATQFSRGAWPELQDEYTCAVRHPLWQLRLPHGVAMLKPWGSSSIALASIAMPCRRWLLGGPPVSHPTRGANLEGLRGAYRSELPLCWNITPQKMRPSVEWKLLKR
jgi:hypothetical protein